MMEEVRRQLEYYLSESNWVRDKYLQSLATEGWIPLEAFMSFPKISAMEATLDILVSAAQSSLMMEVKDAKVRRLNLEEPLAVVLDANAMIRFGEGFAKWSSTKELWTSREALSEVRDEASILRLRALPTEIRLASPSAESLKVVREAAAQTGDLQSLSIVDLSLLALSRDLEIRVASTVKPPAVPVVEKDPVSDDPVSEDPVSKDEKNEKQEAEDPSQSSPVRKVQQASSHILSGPATSGVSSFGGDDDDGIGWEGPGLEEGPALDQETAPSPSLEKSPLEKSPLTACLTADFAMQNVLLRLGLRPLSLDGRHVRKERRFVQRCGACFQVQATEKLFCGRCGSDALRKESTLSDGRLREPRVASRMPRGVKYAVPKPSRFEGGLLLREDQLLTGIWRQKAQRAKAQTKETSVFGPQIVDDFNNLLSSEQQASVPRLTVGIGRNKNPNAQKGRERRGAKKKNKK